MEGRELYQPRGMALDTSASPPVLYVSDTRNNRVLAWKNAAAFRNGQPADLVIGQPDFYSTNAQGPAAALSTGLSNPTGVAVDAKGNLYVVDSGNNRVLRFPQPFAQDPQQLFPDVVIGQPNLASRNPNFGIGQVSAKGLNLSNLSSTLYEANIAFDSAGNLFMTDPGNRRVLAFKASDLTANSAGPAAYVEIGQLDFVSLFPNLSPNDSASPQKINQFAVPSGIAFDSKGRLYVSDSDPNATTLGGSLTGRVLVFSPPFPTSQASAAHIYGVFPPGSPATSLAQVNRVAMVNPEGTFFLPDGSVGIVDSQSSRILIFDSVDNWPSDGSAPQAKAVIGQNADFSSRYPNNSPSATALPPPTAYTFNTPVAAVFLNGQLFVTDTNNNRVVVMPQLSGPSFGPASVALGQDRFDTGSINLVEGREFNFQGTSSVEAGIAIDTTGDTPHLYVADTYNHRVLGFKDLRKIGPGVKADIVLGQPDLQTALCNYNASNPSASGDRNQPNQSGLCGPVGLLVDSSGNLYVADSLNGRVLRFPAPFAHTGLQQADLVLGQRSFFSRITDPTSVTMAGPYGLAFSGNNGLLVSDVVHNRVLYFPFTANGTFNAGTDNGMAATMVFGQQDFISTRTGNDFTSLNAPRHVAADTSGRPYVADTGNNRVLIFNDPHDPQTPHTGATAVYALGGLGSPHGVFVSPTTGEIWVTNTSGGTAVKFPQYDTLILTGQATASIPAANYTLAVTQDQYGDLFVADASSRIGVYYPALVALNAANGLTSRSLAPGLIASIYPLGGQFAGSPAVPARFPSDNAGRYAGDLQRPGGAPVLRRSGADQLLCSDGSAHQRHGRLTGGAVLHRPGPRRQCGPHEQRFAGHFRDRHHRQPAARHRLKPGQYGERSHQPGGPRQHHPDIRHRAGLPAERAAGRQPAAVRNPGDHPGTATHPHRDRLFRGCLPASAGRPGEWQRVPEVLRAGAQPGGRLADQRADTHGGTGREPGAARHPDE